MGSVNSLIIVVLGKTALAHRERPTIELLQRETPKIIPPNLWLVGWLVGV